MSVLGRSDERIAMEDRKAVRTAVALWDGFTVIALRSPLDENSYEYRAGVHCEHGYYHYRWSHACDGCHDIDSKERCLYWGTYGKLFQDK